MKSYCGQSHKKCFFNDKINEIFLGKKIMTQKLTGIDKWIKEKQEDCMHCGEPLLVKHNRDAVKDHCHITGKYRGAAHNYFNFLLRIKPKTDPIPVGFHNLSWYNAHLFFQPMSKIDREISCIISGLYQLFIRKSAFYRADSYRFLQASLDSLVKSTPYEKFKYTPKLC